MTHLSSLRKTLPLALMLGALSACYTPPDITPSAAPSGNYRLDPTHASVVWSLSHAGLSNYTARFDDISGALDFNADTPTDSRVDIIIKASSVSTGLAKFDEEVAFGGKYFDANTYPDIRFTSTQVDKDTDNTGTITGDLTLKGVTLPLTLDVTFNGAGKSFGNPGDTLGFSAKGSFNRSDFGLTHLTNFGIGDKVTLKIETEFNEAR